MIAEILSRRVTSGQALAALPAWTNLHAALMLASTTVTVVVGDTLPVVMAAVASFGLLSVAGRTSGRGQWSGSPANCITAFRLVLLLVACLLLERLPAGALAALLVANVVLDVLDGKVARWLGQTSEIGGVFDRETDAFYVLVAYLYFWLSLDVGVWILIPGVLPFIFRLYAWSIRGGGFRESRQRVASALAGVNFALLPTVAVAPDGAVTYLAVASAAVVACSFIVSFRNLHRRENQLS